MKENIALIMCSSGTTGMPKGVELTQENLSILLTHKYVLGIVFNAKQEIIILEEMNSL